MICRTAAFALAVAGIAFCTPAKASLIGQDFSATYQFPTLGTVYLFASWTPPSFTVGTGQETVADLEGVTNIAADFGAASLTLVLTTILSNPTWNGSAFNGPVFTATLPHGILGASVDPGGTTMAGFDDSRVSVTGTEIRVDWSGLSYVDGTQVSILFSVPEPVRLSILGIGLAGLAVARARRPLPA